MISFVFWTVLIAFYFDTCISVVSYRFNICDVFYIVTRWNFQTKFPFSSLAELQISFSGCRYVSCYRLCTSHISGALIKAGKICVLTVCWFTFFCMLRFKYRVFFIVYFTYSLATTSVGSIDCITNRICPFWCAVQEWPSLTWIKFLLRILSFISEEMDLKLAVVVISYRRSGKIVCTLDIILICRFIFVDLGSKVAACNTSGSGAELSSDPGDLLQTHGPIPESTSLFMGFVFMLTVSSENDKNTNQTCDREEGEENDFISFLLTF